MDRSAGVDEASQGGNSAILAPATSTAAIPSKSPIAFDVGWRASALQSACNLLPKFLPGSEDRKARFLGVVAPGGAHGAGDRHDFGGLAGGSANPNRSLGSPFRSSDLPIFL
jgi:hypothetical protein